MEVESYLSPRRNLGENASYGMTTKQKDWLYAIVNCDYQKISRLISDDVTLTNWRDYITGNTALHYAAKFNKCGVIRLLAGHCNADVNIQNNGGLTPLHMAAQAGSTDAVLLLASSYNANRPKRDYSGRSPRDYISESEANVGLKNILLDNITFLIKEKPLLQYLVDMKGATSRKPCVGFMPWSETTAEVSSRPPLMKEPRTDAGIMRSPSVYWRKKSIRNTSLPPRQTSIGLRSVDKARGNGLTEVETRIRLEDLQNRQHCQSLTAANKLTQQITSSIQRQQKRMSMKYNPLQNKIINQSYDCGKYDGAPSPTGTDDTVAVEESKIPDQPCDDSNDNSATDHQTPSKD